MQITQNAMLLIHEGFHSTHTELGGILGSENGSTVTHIQFDKLDQPPTHPCSYAPNVDFLNQRIAEWKNRGITFLGLFHSHFGCAASLSQGDRMYIQAIMEAMPERIQSLYFPIYVLPECKLVVFRADRSKGLQQEELTIL